VSSEQGSPVGRSSAVQRGVSSTFLFFIASR
jgi:hypothetical protein